MKKICVVGSGRWGRNHISTLYKLNCLGGVVEKNVDVLENLKSKYEGVSFFSNLDDAILKNFDGFTIATPPNTHYEIAKKILLSGHHVLVEKPFTTTVEDAIELNDIAKTNNLNLFVGHVLLFHPAFKKIKRMINEGILGDIQYIYSNRLNLGVVRTEENVLWSLAPHDIALFQYFIGQEPTHIYSYGNDLIQPGIHDTSITTLEYPNKVMGHIFVSWLHPFKEHRFVIVGSKGMIHFEDSASSKPLIFYNKSIEWIEEVPTPKNGSSEYIDYEDSLALDNEMKYFIENLDNSSNYIANGDSAVEVMKILNKCSKNLLRDFG